jgi:hypothetical protein
LKLLLSDVIIVRKDFFTAVGQYVKRGGKTYYKGDDGKLYKNYNDALAVANKPQTGFEYGLSLLGIRPDRSAQSGLEYGMKQLSGLAGTPGKPETGLQYGLQLAGNLFNGFGRGANAQEMPTAQADQSLLGRVLPPGSVVKQFVPPAKPAGVPANIIQPSAIVTGLNSAGEVDRSQSDEYKSQLAQYQNLIKKQQTQEAEDLGMKAWSQKYGQTPMGQAGGAIGVYNPLLATTFPDATNPGYPAFVPAQELAQGDLGTRAQGELGPTMESLNPMAAQAAQQTATAQQADKATTVKLPVRNRVNMFLYGGM